MYALVTDSARPLLQYGSRDWKEIYTDVASYFINKASTFRLIDGAALSHAVLLHLYNFGPIVSEAGSKYPSWTPDWSKRRNKSLPYALDDPSLYSCKRKTMKLQELNDQWFSITPKSSHLSDSSNQGRWQQYCSILRHNPVHMRTEAVGQRLRIEYHPLTFFQQCGIADRVIRPSILPKFWHRVLAAFEPPEIAPTESAENYQTDQDSLLVLLAQMLVKRDEAADKPWRGLVSYTKEIREGLRAHRDDPDALSGQQKMNLQDISGTLRHLAIIRIQATVGSYWAIAPPKSQVGDWVIPLLLSEPSQFVPMMCLRPIESTGARKPRHISHASGMGERCLRLFSGGSIAEVSCLHLTTRFVGPASHCDETPFQPCSEDKETMLEVIMQANEAASGRGLPGPIVFDVV